MVTTLILAGGLGTRLAQRVPHLPKALAPIQGIPFLELLLQQIGKLQFVSKIVLALGHQASAIELFITSLKKEIPVEFSIESTPLGTGGAVLNALKQVTDTTLLVLNGDTYFDLNFEKFVHFHQELGADITIACRKVEDTTRYGSVTVDRSNRVTSFNEKSLRTGPGSINGGIYLIEKNILSDFPSGVYSIEHDFFPKFLQRKFFAFEDNGRFIDIGTPDSYNEAQEILKPWIVR